MKRNSPIFSSDNWGERKRGVSRARWCSPRSSRENNEKEPLLISFAQSSCLWQLSRGPKRARTKTFLSRSTNETLHLRSSAFGRPPKMYQRARASWWSSEIKCLLFPQKEVAKRGWEPRKVDRRNSTSTLFPRMIYFRLWKKPPLVPMLRARKCIGGSKYMCRTCSELWYGITEYAGKMQI